MGAMVLAVLERGHLLLVDHARRQEVLAGVWAMFLEWIVSNFNVLQTAVLNLAPLRRRVLSAFRPKLSKVLAEASLNPPASASMSALPYHVPAAVCQVLRAAAVHAATSAAASRRGPLSPTSLLPPVSRVLVATEGPVARRFLRALSTALAGEMRGRLVVVSPLLLVSLLSAVLGGDAEQHLSLFEEGGEERAEESDQGSRLERDESLSAAIVRRRSPPRPARASSSYRGLRCAWEALREALRGAGEPLVLLVPEAEGLLCGTLERWEAFRGAFCSEEDEAALDPGPGAAVVFLAEVGQAALGAEGGSGAEAKAPSRKAGSPGPRPFPPLDARLPGEEEEAEEINLAQLLGLCPPAPPPRPEPRALLPLAFPSAVDLRAPEGEAGAAHRRLLRADAEDEAESRNAARAAAAAAGAGVRLPERESGAFRLGGARVLSREEWARALAWGVAVCTARQTLQEDGEARRAPQEDGEARQAPCPPWKERACPPLAAFHPGSRRPTAQARWRFAQHRARAAWRAFGRLRRGFPPWEAARRSCELLCTGCLDARPQQAGPRLEAPGPRLDPAHLAWGLRMLERGGARGAALPAPADAFEASLLGEVVPAAECGAGFADVGACAAAKRALFETVRLPLLHGAMFQAGALAAPPTGLLLFGPPGTGKSLLARAAAAECGAAFLAVAPSSLASKWFGDGVRYTRAVFALARKLAPCVVFLDEVDAMLGRRDAAREHEALREMKNEFFACWDGVRKHDGGAGERVLVLGATNRPGDLDPAALRRFSHRVAVPLPDEAGRREVLGVLLRGQALAPDADLAELARLTPHMSGADLKALCVEAAMGPVREALEQLEKEEGRARGRVPPPRAQERDWALALLPAAAALDEGDAEARAPELRPVSGADFRKALAEVGPALEPDSGVVAELDDWAAKHATRGGRRVRNERLSYFM